MSKKRYSAANQMYSEHGKSQYTIARNPAMERLDLIEQVLFLNLAEMSMNRFEWVNLPDSISQRFLEKTMFFNGLAVFYKEQKYDKYLALRASSQGRWNYQDDPTSYTVTGNGMINRILSVDECEPIWPNYLRFPDVMTVRLYASKLAQLDLTIEINSENARRNKVVVAPEHMRHSASQIDHQIQQGQPTLYVNQHIGDMVYALDLGVDPKTITELSILRQRLFSEAMTNLGIDNSNQDKRERLVASEVEANSQQVNAMKLVALNERKDACTRINTRYGLNMSVDFKVEDPPITAEMVDEDDTDALEVEAGDKQKEIE